MRYTTIITLALLSQAALATNKPTPPKTEPTVHVEASPKSTSNSDADAAASSVAVSAANADSRSASNSHSGATAFGGHGGKASADGGNAAATAAGGTSSAEAVAGDSAASADNALSLTQNYEAKRSAPSIAAASVYPTAGCQGGVSLGGSGSGGAGLLGFSFTKRECETVVLAQNFAAIGMAETSCDLLKTTKAWRRATERNPQLAANCEPKPESVAVAEPAPVADTSQFVTREELAERDRRIIQQATVK